MDRRESLQTLLEELSGYPTNRVYFQPPTNTQINYPCVVYSRDNAFRASADNHGYLFTTRYQVTLISRDSDNPIFEKLGRLPKTTPLRSFVVEGLYHDVFQLYY